MIILFQETVYDIPVYDGVMVFFELVLMTIVVNYFLYYGISFLLKNRRSDIFEVEKKLNLGYGLFFIGLAFGYGFYVVDRISRYFTPDRIFLTDTDYGITSIINRDYILFTFIGLGVSFVFLAYVVEKYILNTKVILTWITIFGLGFTVALRFIEVAFYSAAPEIVENLGFISYGVMLLVLIMLLILYGKIIKSSPKGSDLWKRSIAIIVGLLLMVIMLIAGNNQLSNMLDEGIGLNLLGPIITLISLFIMNYGFSRKD